MNKFPPSSASPFGLPEGVTPFSNVYAQYPAFLPAPSATPTQLALKGEEVLVPQKAGSRSLITNHFLSLVGTVLIFLVALTPMWNAYRLLWSSSFVFFMGRSECFIVIVVCVAIVCCFSLTMLLLERFGHVEIKTDETIMYLFTSTSTALGLFLLFMSMPLYSNARGVTDDLMYSCGTGSQTQALSAYYNVLLKMRLKEGCKDLPSIEQCPGYQEQAPYTAFLKDMELNYRCSGFCYKSNSTNSSMTIAALLQEFPDMETKDDFVGLLQGHVEQITVQARGVGDSEGGIVVHAKRVGSSKSEGAPAQNHHVRNKILSLLSSNHSLPLFAGVAEPWNQAKQGYGDTVNNMETIGWMDAYPPTLFTNANFKVTCEGSIAREFRYGVMDISELMYLEGVVLLAASIVVGFMKIFVMFKTASRDPDLSQMAADETSQYFPYMQSFANKAAL